MIKNNFYVARVNNEYILFNTETQDSYTMDKEALHKLFIEEDISYQNFLDAGIIGLNKTTLPFPVIGKFFFESIEVKEKMLNKLEYKEFILNYINDTEKSDLSWEYSKNYVKSNIEIALPPFSEIKADFMTLLKKRRTIREFKNQTVSLQDLSDILYVGFFNALKFDSEFLDHEDSISFRRYAPSAGGIHAIDPYIIVHNVEGLAPGVYFYHCKKHILYLISDEKISYDDITYNIVNQRYNQNSGFDILTVADYNQIYKKYPHIIGSVLPFYDHGHIVQNAILTLTALGLNYWISTLLCKEFFSTKLKLKEHELALAIICVGYGYDDSTGPKLNKILNELKAEKQAIIASVMQTVKNVVKVER